MNPNLLCLNCMSELTNEGQVCPLCGAQNETVLNNPGQLSAGSILAGKYLVGRSLGQGGFGVTYIAYNLNLEKKVAIKEYFPTGFAVRDSVTHSTVTSLPGDKGEFFKSGKNKFVEEAKSLAKFNNPNIVQVYDFISENGTTYIVMDFVEGKTLKEIVQETGGKLPSEKVFEYLIPVMEALSVVHEGGLLHRDISPDNIIITPEGKAVLLDFGAARQISSQGEHSNTINVKHGFAPEEQYRTHGEQGPWTDIYALCATIYKLTTGVVPPQAMDRVLSGEELKKPNELGADFTEVQQKAILKGLSVHGKDRQQSMQELLQDITKQSSSIKQKNEKTNKKGKVELKRTGNITKKTFSKKKRIIAIPTVALLLVGVIASFFIIRDKQNKSFISALEKGITKRFNLMDYDSDMELINAELEYISEFKDVEMLDKKLNGYKDTYFKGLQMQTDSCSEDITHEESIEKWYKGLLKRYEALKLISDQYSLFRENSDLYSYYIENYEYQKRSMKAILEVEKDISKQLVGKEAQVSNQNTKKESYYLPYTNNTKYKVGIKLYNSFADSQGDIVETSEDVCNFILPGQTRNLLIKFPKSVDWDQWIIEWEIVQLSYAGEDLLQ